MENLKPVDSFPSCKSTKKIWNTSAFCYFFTLY